MVIWGVPIRQPRESSSAARARAGARSAAFWAAISLSRLSCASLRPSTSCTAPEGRSVHRMNMRLSLGWTTLCSRSLCLPVLSRPQGIHEGPAFIRFSNCRDVKAFQIHQHLPRPPPLPFSHPHLHIHTLALQSKQTARRRYTKAHAWHGRGIGNKSTSAKVYSHLEDSSQFGEVRLLLQAILTNLNGFFVLMERKRRLCRPKISLQVGAGVD